ncbi:MAG TPA: ATP-binding cassette domain-containing protein [Anaerolineales bacterium]|nr:ATP-binding cassette domain-containing protein [Anaerolineales bacterium]
MSNPIVSIQGLSYQYALTEVPALRDVSLDIAEGEYVAVMGPCGAGKTTLCLSLNGIVPHMMAGGVEGKVVIAGQDTAQTTVRELARTVGMVFDNPEFQLSQVTAREEIALGLENTGVPRDEMIRRIDEVLGLVGLRGFADRSPLAMSGGQQQRLAIAAALAMYPRVLVLDEPTSNLDPIGKEEVFSVCAQLNRERGMTIIIVEHEVEVMAAYASRVVVLSEGRVALNGAPRDVLRQVQALEAVGARAPQVTELAYRLEQRGRRVAEYPVTLEQALAVFPAEGAR